MKIGKNLLFTIYCLLLLSAGIARAQDFQENSISAYIPIIGSIERENGNILDFYEPEFGSVFIVERGRYPTPPLGSEIDLSDMNIVEIYEYLEPDKEIPTAFLEALERHEQVMESIDSNSSNQQELEPEKLEPEIKDKIPAIDMSYSEGDGEGVYIAATQPPAIDEECPYMWALMNIDACHGDYISPYDWHVRWWRRTNTSYFTRDDTWMTDSGACSYRGNIKYKLEWRRWWVWSSVSSYLDTGEWISLHRYDPPLDFDIRSTVSQASGDGYHHCGRGRT